MREMIRNVLWTISNFVSSFEFTTGLVFVVALSCVLSIVTNHFSVSTHALSLDSSVVLNGDGKIGSLNISWMHWAQTTN